MLKTIFIAATALTLSSVAQADTIKQIWNQELGEGNPGRVESTGDCLKDDSSNFGCWSDRDDFDPDTGGGAAPAEPEDPPPNGGGETPGNGPGPGNGQGPGPGNGPTGAE